MFPSLKSPSGWHFARQAQQANTVRPWATWGLGTPTPTQWKIHAELTTPPTLHTDTLPLMTGTLLIT